MIFVNFLLDIHISINVCVSAQASVVAQWSYLCVCLCICIYTHIHMWERDRERKIGWKKEESKGKEKNYKEVTQAEKSPDLQLASWRPKRPDCKFQPETKIIRTRRVDDVSSSLRLSLSESRRRSFSQHEKNEWNQERKKEKMNIFLLFSFFCPS